MEEEKGEVKRTGRHEKVAGPGVNECDRGDEGLLLLLLQLLHYRNHKHPLTRLY